MKPLIPLSSLLILLTGCDLPKEDHSENPQKNITIEVSDSEVVRIDGKEVHLSFLEDQISAWSEEYQLITEIDVRPDAGMGGVHEVQSVIHPYITEVTNVR